MNNISVLHSYCVIPDSINNISPINHKSMSATWIKICCLAIITASAISCDSYRHIYTNRDESVDFDKYRTFAWAPDSTDNEEVAGIIDYDVDIVSNNAKNYITNNLTSRGLLLNIDSPDLVLKLVLVNERKEKVVTYHSYPYAGYYYYSPFYFPYYYPYYRFYTWYGPYPPSWDTETSVTKTYVRGTIRINFFDRKLQKLIWTGIAEGDLYDPSYIQYAVHPAIDRILKRFPIKQNHRPRKLEDRKDTGPVVRSGKPTIMYNVPVSGRD